MSKREESDGGGKENVEKGTRTSLFLFPLVIVVSEMGRKGEWGRNGGFLILGDGGGGHCVGWTRLGG